MKKIKLNGSWKESNLSEKHYKKKNYKKNWLKLIKKKREKIVNCTSVLKKNFIFFMFFHDHY